MMFIFFILTEYLIPLLCLIISLIFIKQPPKEINHVCGYRTTRSTKNIDTWNEANKYFVMLLFKYSLFLLLATTIIIIFFGKFYLSATVIFGSIFLDIIFIIIPVIKTENHLKKMFGD